MRFQGVAASTVAFATAVAAIDDLSQYALTDVGQNGAFSAE
jgi:hypothetical protein